MFKYPAQSARERAKRRGSARFFRHESAQCRRGVRKSRCKTGKLWKNPRITAASQLLLHGNHSQRCSSLTTQRTADSVEESCRWPLFFSTTPTHDPGLSDTERELAGYYPSETTRTSVANNPRTRRVEFLSDIPPPRFRG